MFHPDWLDALMKVAIWAKRHHADHSIGPFSAFNSSDQVFHEWQGVYGSPHGKYVIKQRMGAQNYLYFRDDFERLGFASEINFKRKMFRIYRSKCRSSTGQSRIYDFINSKLKNRF